MTYNIHPYACLIVLLACVLSCTDAFIGGLYHGQARIQSKRQNQSIQTLISIKRNTQIRDDKRISSTITLHANKKDKENDVKERTYTKIDDGSPIGVAIVLLGLLGNIYFPGSLSAINYFTDEKYVWIVLATASTAAGLARLLRYYRDKDEVQ